MNGPPTNFPDDYDVQIGRTIPFYRLFIGETINLLRSLEAPPKLWLDTGCGTGEIIKEALDVFPGTMFLLTDPSEKMLSQARMKLGNKGRVRFLRPSTTQDLKESIVERPDVITAIQCHHYLSRMERTKAVGVCFDMLVDGGLYVTFENVRPLTEEGIAIGKRNWGRFQTEKGKGKDEVDQHLARFDHEYFPITVEEHLGLLREAGFRTVEVFWYSYMQAGFYCIK